MHLGTKHDLSVVYWLKNLFVATPSITVTDSFPTGELLLPTVAVDSLDLDAVQFELGNRDRLLYRSWDLDIFASTKAQRDEIGYTIIEALENPILVYDYALGFPPSSIPQIGCLIPEDIHMRIISVIPDLVEKMYYRSLISFTSTYQSV